MSDARPVRRSRAGRHRSVAAALAGIAAAAALMGHDAATARAAGGPVCDLPADIHTVAISGSRELRVYSPDGQLRRTVASPPYREVAFTPDGRMWGLETPRDPLYRIDPVTGAVLSAAPLSGPLAGDASADITALTSLGDGRLLAATSASDLYAIDPGTGDSTAWRRFPVDELSIEALLRLPDGDVLVAGDHRSVSVLFGQYRFAPDGTTTKVGNSIIRGLARSGGRYHILGVGVMRLARNIPPTAGATWLEYEGEFDIGVEVAGGPPPVICAPT